MTFMAGRVSTLAVDPQNPDHWLAGFGNSGVWESRDAGTSWTSLSDRWPSLAIGAIAFAPSAPHVIYVATGEAASVGFARAGIGIVKSTDGGGTWSIVGASSFARTSVRRLHVHPANPDIVVAASARGGFGRDSQESVPGSRPFGVLRSTDGGVSWVRTLAGHATALEVDGSNFNNQYAAIGDQRRPIHLGDHLDSVDNGVYRSTDGGVTWAAIRGPWGSSVGRVELALAAANPDVLYASIQRPTDDMSGGPDGRLLGLYRTETAWSATPTWVQVPTEAMGNDGYCGPTKCGYVHVLSVDPADPNRLFAGGFVIWRCTTCTSSPAWTGVQSDLHSDFHAMAWAGRRLIVGTDGGIWSTTDFGATWQDHNRALPTLMFFSGALHPTNPTHILAGLRDYPPSVRTGRSTWLVLHTPGIHWGEADVAISSRRPETDWVIGEPNGNIYRTLDGGRSGVPADAGIDKAAAAFVAPVRKCPSNDDVFLTGTNRMYRSNDFFSASRPTWSQNSQTHPGMVWLLSPGTILSIAFYAPDPTCNTYAFGNRGGEVQLTRDGGRAWTDLDPRRMLPARPVNSLAFDSSNEGTVYAAISSFDEATPFKPGHVFKTTNAFSSSPTWTNISPPDDLPFNVVAVDPTNPSGIYAGSDAGLWFSGDAGATWHRGIDAGLSNAPVYDIQFNPATKRTVVFTYGRGAFMLSVGPAPPANPRAVFSGGVVTLSWEASAGASSYLVQVGTASGSANLFNGNVGAVLGVSGAIADGNYFWRVMAVNAAGQSSPSAEGRFGTLIPPARPNGLQSQVNGSAVVLSWNAAADLPPAPLAPATSYILAVGTAPTQTDLFNGSLGNTTTVSGMVGNGTYYWRVVAANAYGRSPASAESQFTVGCTAVPGSPQMLTSSVSGSTVTLQWTTGAGVAPTAYQIEAGSATGLSNLASFNTGSTAITFTAAAPRGTYFVRVRAVNACGVSAATNEVVVVVR
jgi:photosystem II stability/assembly factor-like uncharacterized protein